MCEFQKRLNHLNKKISTPVNFFTLLNLVYTLSIIIFLYKIYNTKCPVDLFSLNIINFILWLIISTIPFLHASNLSFKCRSSRSCGHQIRIRPFVHHNTSSEDLNSVLLYSSSLKMSARLFRIPIKGHYLCFLLLCFVIAILTIGMCMYRWA